MARTRIGLGWAAIVVLVVLILASIAAAFLLGRSSNTGPKSSSPTITEIQRLGELVVLRVNVADVLEDANKDFKGLWIVRGDALVAVDLRLAQLQSTDVKTKRLAVRLPQPKVTHPRVDHEKTRTYDIQKKTWWNPFVDGQEEFTDQAMRKAQSVVYNTSTGQDVMDQAREQTELMLNYMYRLVGWDVDVVWQSSSEASKTAQ